ncbi:MULTISPECIES: serine kinase/phosphatase [Pseudomonas]|uniref:Serine kinase/phosphatase n=1 Tax=Pseudomonas sessilinigenes TaxID=658629 RepID=A0ABX8MMA6_9PSED|nr:MULTISPECIES: serine kinase/phosphatase [Pseudomonas]AZC26065.1 Phosphotransferase system, HPr-related protein [Pseudomonas sessilinigenes]QIH10837.1 serine kinase/phosphatase [Pseudomonas sp. BIOMIG1BAC]QXH39902.1 serine kinase/phosphatase [Pseudomonas sessilinigenes]
MTESRRPYRAVQPAPIDDDQDRMGSMEELHFNDLAPGSGHGHTITEDGSTDDDLSPEILIPEDGARSAWEQGANKPADWDLSIVDERDIGGGVGLDEAELARRKPLDGKP